MYTFRKWLYKPKKADTSLLAQFYFADEELNNVASELDSFDSRKDPERCQTLVAQLRACQDRVLTIVQRMMVEAVTESRTSRDFRVKFPDDVVQENLSGQLWFGAECLAAGSSIMNREAESASMRPLARALTKNLDSLRHILRDQCLVSVNEYTERIKEALIIFDKLFAEFELSYVSAMVPVKTVKEYETIQEITVLFSETTIRAKALGYITTDMIDEYDPALMFTIPRLAIVCGLLVFPDGPLNPDSPSWNMSDMFRPFQTLLFKIRELLFTLSDAELLTLERALCSQQEPDYIDTALSTTTTTVTTIITTTTTSTSAAPSPIPFSTSTIAVQTESCLLSKHGMDDSMSCSSQCSTESMPTEEQSCQRHWQKRRQRDDTLLEIVCQTGGSQQTVASSGCRISCEEGETWRNESCDALLPTDHGGSRLNPSARNLNKSDSNDSGLHSDVVSSSDSQFTISSSDSNQLLSFFSSLQSSSEEQVSELIVEDDYDDSMADFGETVIDPGTVGQPLPVNAHTEVLLINPTETASFGSDTGLTEESHPPFTSTEQHSETWFGHADAGQVRLSTAEEEEEEEERFYTPLTGFSPLHQPNLSPADAEYRDVAALCFADTVNSGSYNFGFTHDMPDTSCCMGNLQQCCVGASSNHNNSGIDNRTFTRQFSGVLQKVQAMFTSSPSVSIEVDSSWDSEMSDSPLTDTTLTDIVPLDTGTHEDHHPFPTCDTSGSAMAASCDMERQYQNDFDPALAQGNSTGTATDLFSDMSGSRTSSSLCDRCTQTPHSVINNDQSLKIHHHHHRKHSSPVSTASSVSSSSAHGTPSSVSASSATLAFNRDSGSSEKDRKSLSSSQKQQDSDGVGVAARSSQADKRYAGKECQKPSAPGTSTSRNLNITPPRTSLRTPQQKPSAPKPPASSVSELKQCKKGWSKHHRGSTGGKANRNVGTSSSSSGCEGSSSASDCESDQDSCGSSETSSYNSESHDDEEIALAVQAAELANRNQARARFRSSSDMIHRLFVCISGVADQLQTNFAGDLRNILRVVFNLNCSEPVVMEEEKAFRRRLRANRFFHQHLGGDSTQHRGIRDPPVWIPDEQSTNCMSCKTPFTFVRRRHHCRNCGKIFCGRCSSNAVSLPHFGHSKPVRVCNHCFVFQVNPFAVS